MTDNASLARHCGVTCPSTSNSPGGPGPPGCTEFADMFGVETVERYLHSSYDQFAGRATVPNFLPRRYEEWVLDDPAGL